LAKLALELDEKGNHRVVSEGGLLGSIEPNSKRYGKPAGGAWSGKVDTGFPKRSCSNKKIERDDDSKKSHYALAQLDAVGTSG
jgi:hypothetical protein